MSAFDTTICALGEGALWHPIRQELFWFDITSKRLLRKGNGPTTVHHLPEMHSAAAWIDEDRLLVASETALWEMEIDTGTRTRLIGLEDDNPVTRSNDGRCDPWGGFWIGTMGKAAEEGAGAIYRYAHGELRRLYALISIPNAMCFDHGRGCAYFADTAAGKLYRVSVDALGWPDGQPQVLVDFAQHGLNPDGAVVLADGRLAVALWGASAVMLVDPDGTLGDRIALPAPHVTCPAMGGADFATLYCTSATEGMDADALSAAPLAGVTFAIQGAPKGLPEPAFPLPTGGTR